MTQLTGRERGEYAQDPFTRIARRYDLMNRLMTAGQDVRWRRQVIRLARLSPGDQAAGLPPQLIQSLRSLGAGRRALFRVVYLPASLPAILTALRQSVGTAVAVLYIAELFATRYGLGYYIYYNGATLLNHPAMYAGVVAMSLLGLLLYCGIDWQEKRLVPWMGAGAEAGKG